MGPVNKNSKSLRCSSHKPCMEVSPLPAEPEAFSLENDPTKCLPLVAFD